MQTQLQDKWPSGHSLAQTSSPSRQGLKGSLSLPTAQVRVCLRWFRS